MNVLLITPHKSEMAFYFLQQQVEMIKSLKDELMIRNKSIDVNILPLHQIDAETASLKDMKQLFEKNRSLIERADIIHSFSEIPLFFRPYFPSTLLLTLNLERKYDVLKPMLPSPEEPGIEITTSVKCHTSIPYQELLPGFIIDVPKDEFRYDSKNIIIFASTRSFINKAKKVISSFLPDANYYIKLRASGSLEEKEELFNINLTDDFSFLFGVTETDVEKEPDLIPLKMLSKGIPVFLLNSPLEKKFYPEYLHLSTMEELADKFKALKKKISKEETLRDELHSFSCRYFFFSKMTDDIIRLYQNILNNKKKADSRPWGFWESLKLSDNYKVKHIFVAHKEKLSLQTHKHRDEIWTIVQGSGSVTVEDETFDAKKGDVFIVEKEKKHRAEGGREGMHIIEVQMGDYLGEDDIKRLEDVYGREK